ncbi:glycosyltransferase, partial [Actinomyces slackii]
MTGAGVAVLLRRGDAQTDQEQAQEQLEELVAATAESFAAVAGPDDELIECESWQEGAARATAPYALMLRAGDRLEPGALRALSGFAQARSARLITADRIESGRIRRCPRWSPGLMEQMPYAGRALLVDTGLLAGEPEAQGPGQGQSGQSVWGPRPPRSEWDLQLRLACAAGGAEHCPVVALHQAQPVEVGDLGERIATTREHLERQGRQGRGERVIPGPTGWPRVVAGEAPTGMVSIIVPTAFSARPTQDGGTRVLVEGLLSALAETIDAARTEVVLVVGESTGPEPIERCRALWPGRLEVATTRGAFNFAAAINAGADASSGDLLLLLNDDVEPIRPGWLEDMLAVLGRPGVGAVGARLLFPDGTIQHLGVICPPVGLATHPRVG